MTEIQQSDLLARLDAIRNRAPFERWERWQHYPITSTTNTSTTSTSASTSGTVTLPPTSFGSNNVNVSIGSMGTITTSTMWRRVALDHIVESDRGAWFRDIILKRIQNRTSSARVHLHKFRRLSTSDDIDGRFKGKSRYAAFTILHWFVREHLKTNEDMAEAVAQAAELMTDDDVLVIGPTWSGVVTTASLEDLRSMEEPVIIIPARLIGNLVDQMEATRKGNA